MDMNNYRVAFFWSFCDIGMMFDYKQSDFNDISDVKRLFENCRDSCLKIGDYWARSPMCQMYNEGWEFLIERFGYEDLFKINREVGWLNTEDIELFKSDIVDLMSEEQK